MPHAADNPMTASQWALLFALSLGWGGSFFFNAKLVPVFPPFTIAFLRVALSAVVLLIVLVTMRVRFPTAPKTLAAFLVMGLLNNAIPFSLIVWGRTKLPSGLASILNATTPLFTVVAAHFLTANGKMTPDRLGGVVLGVVGVAILFRPALPNSAEGPVLAQLAILMAALCYAFAAIFGRIFTQFGVSPIVTAAGQLTASTLWLLPVTLIVDKPWTLAVESNAFLLPLLGSVLISTVLSYIAYFRLLSTAGPRNLLLAFLIPVSAIALGWMFLGERLRPEHFAGLFFIALSLALVDGPFAGSILSRNSRSAEIKSSAFEPPSADRV